MSKHRFQINLTEWKDEVTKLLIQSKWGNFEHIFLNSMKTKNTKMKEENRKGK